jgi:hypothetical protein
MAEGDLIYVIRAGSIEDKNLMDKATVQQVVEFLLYMKFPCLKSFTIELHMYTPLELLLSSRS